MQRGTNRQHTMDNRHIQLKWSSKRKFEHGFICKTQFCLCRCICVECAYELLIKKTTVVIVFHCIGSMCINCLFIYNFQLLHDNRKAVCAIIGTSKKKPSITEEKKQIRFLIFLSSTLKLSRQSKYNNQGRIDEVLSVIQNETDIGHMKNTKRIDWR